MITPLPPDEANRLREIAALQILDTPPEQEYDDLVHLASHICGTPIALMSLIDADRQWWKSRTGLPGSGTSRDIAFCAHAILEPKLMQVSDAKADERFADNPLVTSDPSIRFYAGMPMVTPSGHALGTLCVIDRVPRELNDGQKAALEALSRQAVVLLELRRAKLAAEQAHGATRELLAKLTAEQEKSDRLLSSLFPPTIAERLRSEPLASIAEEHPAVTILFADLTNLWPIAGTRPPAELVQLLNRVFSLFDGLVAAHGAEKVKTIGDTYMAVAGVEGTRGDHAAAIAELALSMQREICGIDTGTREPLDIRIGIHSGPVVAGVVGIRRLAYDMWGPTVAMASQMDTCGVPGGVQVSAATHALLADQYLFEPRGEFYVPGEGEVSTFLLTGRGRRPSPR